MPHRDAVEIDDFHALLPFEDNLHIDVFPVGLKKSITANLRSVNLLQCKRAAGQLNSLRFSRRNSAKPQRCG